MLRSGHLGGAEAELERKLQLEKELKADLESAAAEQAALSQEIQEKEEEVQRLLEREREQELQLQEQRAAEDELRTMLQESDKAKAALVRCCGVVVVCWFVLISRTCKLNEPFSLLCFRPNLPRSTPRNWKHDSPPPNLSVRSWHLPLKRSAFSLSVLPAPSGARATG